MLMENPLGKWKLAKTRRSWKVNIMKDVRDISCSIRILSTGWSWY
jgi:hypothetical protein